MQHFLTLCSMSSMRLIPQSSCSSQSLLVLYGMMIKNSKVKNIIIVSVDSDSIHTEQATTSSNIINVRQSVSW